MPRTTPGMTRKWVTTMDELLYDRVKQLKEIDERLRQMLTIKPDQLHKAIRDLRNDVAVMIERAEEEHAAF